ncbi:MAG: apolipoprotein N-acyltransferase [Candidatus Marinimicrobia bacterium]|nr:apolipoprotein N-acyltransferase [Candidatus Neomarinimicrobiota bacterium]
MKKVRINGWLLILMSGILSVLAFPPLRLGFLAFFALVPLIKTFCDDEFHLGFEKGLIYGIVLNLGIMYWLALNKGTDWYWATLSMLSSVLFLALNYAVIGLSIGFIGRRLGRKVGIWSFPIVWTAVEYLRTFGTLGFTWNNLCYTQTQAIQLIQSAALVGSYGISAWIVVINVLIFRLLENIGDYRQVSKRVAVILTLFLIPAVYGGSVLKTSSHNNDRRSVSVGLIQPNVDPNAKWDQGFFKSNMQLLHDLTDSVAVRPIDLVVWPETATPTFLRRNYRGALDRIREHITTLDVNLLTGVPDFDGHPDPGYRYYNAAFLLRPNSDEIEDYRKIQLVPFGEYIPLSHFFPELNNLNLGQGNFEAGSDMKVFHIPLKTDRQTACDTVLTFNAVVCYESTFPALVRQAARLGSELLVIVSNDAWFGNASAPFLHAEIARFRAIENHIPVVRSANTGVSLILDQYGRNVQYLAFGRAGWLSATLSQGQPTTIFVKYGNWPAGLCVIMALLLLGYSMIKRRKA